jgi:hypothetical protein
MSTATTWERLPAIQGKFKGCLCCGVAASFFPPQGQIAVGFGYAALHRDREVVWTEPQGPVDDDAYMTGEQAEKLAAANPDHDWRIVLEAPLSSRTYQRHAPGHWALIEQGMGFA